jgi:hypothetical protein
LGSTLSITVGPHRLSNLCEDWSTYELDKELFEDMVDCIDESSNNDALDLHGQSITLQGSV